MAYPLAALPNSFTVDVNGSITVVAIAVLHIKLKQLGAGCLLAGFLSICCTFCGRGMASVRYLYTIGFDAVDRIFPVKVDCKRLNFRVIDVHYAQAFEFCRIDRAVVKVNCNIRCIAFVIDVYDLAGRIKGTVIKCHRGRAVCPQRIATIRAIKSCILECCGGIAPVGCSAQHDAIFNIRYFCV